MKELKIIVTVNENGYKNIDLKIGNQTIYLTRSLTRFEINYLANRSNRLVVGVEEEIYKGIPYSNLVVREKDGYENEYIVIKGLDPAFKHYLISELLADSLGA